MPYRPLLVSASARTFASSLGVLAASAQPAWRGSAESASNPLRLRGGRESSKVEVTWRRLAAGGESCAAESAPIARSSHEVSLVGGSVLLFGGEHQARMPIDANLWALEQKTEGTWSWQQMAVSGEAPSPRIGHAQAAVDTRLYVMGGRQGITMDEAPLNDLFCFDTTTSAWERIEPAPGSALPPTPRSYHRMVYFPSIHIHIRTCKYETSHVCRHVFASPWLIRKFLSSIHALQVAVGPLLYVFGGCDVAGRAADLHCFDTRSHLWTNLPSADMAGRGGAGFVALDNGNLAVFTYTCTLDQKHIHASISREIDKKKHTPTPPTFLCCSYIADNNTHTHTHTHIYTHILTHTHTQIGGVVGGSIAEADVRDGGAKRAARSSAAAGTR